jgi:hypothetical protein
MEQMEDNKLRKQSDSKPLRIRRAKTVTIKFHVIEKAVDYFTMREGLRESRSGTGKGYRNKNPLEATTLSEAKMS